MEKFVRKYSITSILMSVLFVIVGIIMMVFPSIIVSIMIMLGIILIIIGAFTIINSFRDKSEFSGYSYDFALGVTSLIFGIIMVANPKLLISVFPLLLGIWIIFQSLLKLQLSIKVKNAGGTSWPFILIVSILTTILGVLLVINPFGAVETIIALLGIFTICYGIADIIETICVLNSFK